MMALHVSMPNHMDNPNHSNFYLFGARCSTWTSLSFEEAFVQEPNKVPPSRGLTHRFLNHPSELQAEDETLLLLSFLEVVSRPVLVGWPSQTSALPSASREEPCGFIAQDTFGLLRVSFILARRREPLVHDRRTFQNPAQCLGI